MKISWRTLLLWSLPLLVVGFFLWQGTFFSFETNMGSNTANARMTYGRFLEYLDSGRILEVDLYEGGRTAIVQAVDPELENRIQELRVDLPINTPDLIAKLRKANVDLESHPVRNEGALWGFLGNLLFPILLIGALFFLFRRSNNLP
ncbi:MAG: ATP-dependent metallopeptidase FtsH/Yme1/Tma family protein, partial [cyanobacterium endosymbiont of Rhopalodia yunnanensis]